MYIYMKLQPTSQNGLGATKYGEGQHCVVGKSCSQMTKTLNSNEMFKELRG